MALKEDKLTKIVGHISILNGELGRLDQSFKILQADQKILKTDISLMRTDINWIKRIGYFISTTILIGIGKILFFG